MDNKTFVIDIVGNQKDVVDHQSKIVNTIPHVLVNSHLFSDPADYLEKLTDSSDIVLVNLSDHALLEMKSIENASIDSKSVVVIGDKNNVRLLSAAISVGVAEFLDRENYQKELTKVINKIVLNKTVTYKNTRKRKMNAFINAKGGGGASFIASNVAYTLSQMEDLHVALLDLDLQFGCIGLNFDVSPKYTIVEALQAINEIDHLSLQAYMSNYNDHLKLLLPSSEEIILPGEVQPGAIKSLLYLLQRNCNQIVIDLPRLIDPLAMSILEQADHIAIVVQQTLAQYRDGRRMIQILNKDLDIPLEKIIVVINRFDPKNSLKKSDMIKLVSHENVFTIENDFDRVASASNLGVPLCSTSPKSKIAKDIKKLAFYLGDAETTHRKAGILGHLKALFA